MVGAAVAYRPLDGIALLVALVGAVVVAARPAIGGYLLAALVPITSGFRKGFPIPNVNLSEALIAGIGGLVILTAPRHASLRWRAVDWLLVAFCLGWLGFGLFNAEALHTSLKLSTLDPLLGPFQFLILYRAMAASLRQARERHVAIAALLLASLPVDLLAFLQQARIGAVNRMIARITGGDLFQTYTYHFFARATGPFPHWTPLAGYLSVILMVGLACLLFQVDLALSRTALGVVLLLGAVSLVLSAEISALVGCIAGAVLLGVWAGRTRQAVRSLVVALTVVAIFGGSYFLRRLGTQFGSTAGSGRSSFVPQTIEFRWHVWTGQYFPAIAQRPLTGWGQALPATISWPFTESQYVTDLMAGGVIVLALFAAMMVALYRQARRQALDVSLGDRPTSQALGNAIAVLVLILVPMDAIFPYVTSGGLPQALFAVAGIAAGALYWDRCIEEATPLAGLVAAETKWRESSSLTATSPQAFN